MTDTAQTPTRPSSARAARTSRRAKATKLKAITAAPPPAPTATTPAAVAKAPREGSRLAAMVALMRRPEGASVDALAETTGWQRHSVRGALAGALKKTYGLAITSSVEEGARIYRIASTQVDA